MEARIIVSTLSYNYSVMTLEENGEINSSPVHDTTEEEFLVKKGDRVKGFEVLELTPNFLVLKSLLEYTEGMASEPKTQFIIEKGESLNLNMHGVYDVVNKVSITYVAESDMGERNMAENTTDRSDERPEEYIVTKEEWEIEPMPMKNTQFTIERKFTPEDIKRIKRGHSPVKMEDKWFYYFEDGKAYYHRSWSGYCIYIVEFDFKNDNHIVTVNRDENQYSNTDIDEDIQLINDLLN